MARASSKHSRDERSGVPPRDRGRPARLPGTGDVSPASHLPQHVFRTASFARHLSPQASSPLLSIILAFALAIFTTFPARAADKITFDDHVFPLFEQSCLNCHNPDKTKGGLDLSNYSGVLKGSSGGKIAEPGDGASSTLYTSVTHTSENKMPPKGDKLPKKSADLIRAWIDAGLLETASSSAKKRRGPKIDLSVKIDASAKPDGPPPMPRDLPLEPHLVARRSTSVADMATSPWAPLLAITGQKQVLLYNTDTLRLAGILPFDTGQPEVLSFHPSGTYLLAGGGIPGKSGTTITWDITTGKELMRNGREFDSVLGASLRLDLGAVAIGGPSRLIKLWDTQSAEQSHSIKKHTDWITSLAYSPDGILLATADRNGGVWVWEADTGNEFHTLRAHQKSVNAVRWRADSNLLATASEDGDVIFWEMDNGKQVKKLKAHPEGILAFDYARDGRFLTSGRDRKVKLWKPDFTILKELPTFSELVVEVAITNDGKRLVTADWNGKVEVWDADSLEMLGTLSTNPPHIAHRLTELDKELAAIAAAITAAKATLKTGEQAVAKARQTVEDALQNREHAKKRLAEIKPQLGKIDKEWNTLESRPKELADTRQQLRTESKALTEQIPSLEKAIKPARGHLAERENALLPLKAARDKLRQRETNLRQDQVFWKSAAAR